MPVNLDLPPRAVALGTVWVGAPPDGSCSPLVAVYNPPAGALRFYHPLHGGLAQGSILSPSVLNLVTAAGYQPSKRIRGCYKVLPIINMMKANLEHQFTYLVRVDTLSLLVGTLPLLRQRALHRVLLSSNLRLVVG